jgi:methyl-accepting chemotaxis protein/methyl-accepting chemotaxis protein-1 (serine sensor receptor)
MSIRVKAFFALATLLLSVLFLSGWAFYTRQQCDAEARITAGGAQTLTIFSTMKSEIMQMRLAHRGTSMFASVQDEAKFASCNQQFDRAVAELRKSIEEAKPLVATEAATRTLREIEGLATQYAHLHIESVDLCKKGKAKEAIAFDSQNSVAVGKGLSDAADQLFQAQVELNADSMKRVSRLNMQSLVVNIVVALLAIANVIVVWIGVGRVVRQLSEATSNLYASAEQVAGAAGQVSSSAQVLAQGASEQAASIEETSASTQEISAITQQNAESSRSAAGAVEQSHLHVAKADSKLSELVTSMAAISASSSEIAKIIKEIDGIAFQTNILALNAAVEAARAGDAGLGFAVVADEVRNLAQRCAQAAKDTSLLIDESVKNAVEGSGRVSAVEAAVRRVVTAADETKVLVNEVTASSNEQAKGLNQIAAAIAQMESTTQQNAATAQQSAAAGAELTAQAETLRDIVSGLQRLVSGDTAFA